MNTPYTTKQELINLLDNAGFLTPKINEAIVQAELSHGQQTRDDGQPYLEEHIYPVTKEVLHSYGNNPIPEKVVMAAILHDAIEDDPNFTEAICLQKFSQEVLDILIPLTKTLSENTHYLSQEEKMAVKMAVNKKHHEEISRSSKEAITIKLADRYNNIACIGKIKTTKPEKYKRYILETEKFFLALAKQHSPYFFDKINDVLSKLKLEPSPS